MCIGAGARRGGGPGRPGRSSPLEERSGPSVPPGESRARAEPRLPAPVSSLAPSRPALAPVLRVPLPKGPFPLLGRASLGGSGAERGAGVGGSPRPSSANGKGGRAGCVGGEGGAAGARRAGGGPGGGGRSPRGARRVNPSAAGPSRRRSPSRGRRSGCRRGGRELGARRARAGGAQRGDAAERGPRLRLGPADRCAGGRSSGRARGPEPAPSGGTPRPQPSPGRARALPGRGVRGPRPGRATRSLCWAGPGRGGWGPARPAHGLRMPVRRGHVAPQNTFLDTIIRKFEGQSEWGRGPAGRGFWGRAEISGESMGGGRARVQPASESVVAGDPKALTGGRRGRAWCWGAVGLGPRGLGLGRAAGGSG